MSLNFRGIQLTRQKSARKIQTRAMKQITSIIFRLHLLCFLHNTIVLTIIIFSFILSILLIEERSMKYRKILLKTVNTIKIDWKKYFYIRENTANSCHRHQKLSETVQETQASARTIQQFIMAEHTASTNSLALCFETFNKYRQDRYESPVAKKQNVIAKQYMITLF